MKRCFFNISLWKKSFYCSLNERNKMRLLANTFLILLNLNLYLESEIDYSKGITLTKNDLLFALLYRIVSPHIKQSKSFQVKSIPLIYLETFHRQNAKFCDDENYSQHFIEICFGDIFRSMLSVFECYNFSHLRLLVKKFLI